MLMIFNLLSTEVILVGNGKQIDKNTKFIS